MFSLNSTKVGYSTKAHFITSQSRDENLNKNKHCNNDNENDSVKNRMSNDENETKNCVKSGLNNKTNHNDGESHEFFNWVYFILILSLVAFLSITFCLFVKYVYYK